jgi:hypothetical protein
LDQWRKEQESSNLSISSQILCKDNTSETGSCVSTQEEFDEEERTIQRNDEKTLKEMIRRQEAIANNLAAKKLRQEKRARSQLDEEASVSAAKVTKGLYTEFSEEHRIYVNTSKSVANYVNNRLNDEYYRDDDYDKIQYEEGRTFCKENMSTADELKENAEDYKDITKSILNNSPNNEWEKSTLRTIETQEQQVHNLDEHAKAKGTIRTKQSGQ